MIGQNVTAAIEAAGFTPEAVAKATDATISSLGSQELSLEEIVAVGGFLHVSPRELLSGVAA